MCNIKLIVKFEYVTYVECTLLCYVYRLILTILIWINMTIFQKHIHIL